MSRFTTLPASEIERRRSVSIDALKQIRSDEFTRWYQERCDARYWKHGRCCAGCDYWASEAGDVGECSAAPLVSGADVIRSLGISWCSYTPPPGQPYTRSDHVCGAFKDDFDWSSLPSEYLERIGAASVTGTGTAETSQKAQGEACQNGPQGDAQNTPQVTDNEL